LRDRLRCAHNGGDAALVSEHAAHATDQLSCAKHTEETRVSVVCRYVQTERFWLSIRALLEVDAMPKAEQRNDIGR
jgi:hypothetical protein